MATDYFHSALVGSLQVSHLLYADDVLFLGDRSRDNIRALV